MRGVSGSCQWEKWIFFLMLYCFAALKKSQKETELRQDLQNQIILPVIAHTKRVLQLQCPAVSRAHCCSSTSGLGVLICSFIYEWSQLLKSSTFEL